MPPDGSDTRALCARLIDALPTLVAALRADAYEIGVDQHLAAGDRLLLAGADTVPLGRDTCRAALSGIFCTEPEQQQRFVAHFDAWWRAIMPARSSAPRPVPSRPAALHPPPPWWRRQAATLSLLLALAVAGGGLFLLFDGWQAPPPPPPPPALPKITTPGDTSPIETTPRRFTPPPRTAAAEPSPPAASLPGWVAAPRSLFWLFAALWVGWLAWLLLRRAWVLRRQKQASTEPRRLEQLRFAARRDDLFTDPHLATAWRHLRAFRSAPSKRLHEAASVERTLREGGFFHAIYRERQVPPAYLLFIDRRHAEDHAAAVADALATRLAHEHVAVRCYSFRENLAFCTPAGAITPQRSASALLAEHPDADLLVAGEAGSLLDASGREPQAWLRDCLGRRNGALMTAGPAWAESDAAHPLAEAGMRIIPLTDQGIAAAFGASDDRSPDTATDTPDDLPPPASLVGEAPRWLRDTRPHRTDRERLLETLHGYLGEDGLLLFTAVASYPGVYWNLTRALDLQLALPPARRPLRLRRLAQLPWLRAARLPEWMRDLLLAAAPPADLQRIAAAFNALLNADEAAAHVALPVEVPDWRSARAERLAEQPTLPPPHPGADRVFASVIVGRRPRRTEFRLPRVVDWRAPAEWRGLLPPFAAGLLLLPAIAWSGHWAAGHWLLPMAREQALAELHAANATLAVVVQAPDELREYANVLRADLQARGFAVATVDPAAIGAGQGTGDKTAGSGVVSADSGGTSRQAGIDKAVGTDKAASTATQDDQADTGADDTGATASDIAPAYGVPVLGIDGAPAQVLYAPGDEAAAKRLAARVAWLYHDDVPAVRLQTDTSLAAGSAIVELAAAPRVFRQSVPVLVPPPLVDFPVPEMIALPGGTFRMGSPADEPGRNPNEGPVHSVVVPPFAIGRYAVTFEEYDAFVTDTGGQSPGDAGWGRGRRPVVDVSWDDATAYAVWLSEKTDRRYRLPSEAEWEYAARAGTAGARWWGEGVRGPDGKPMAVCDGCGSEWDNDSTAPVGSFRANAFGLHDVMGNALEWVADCWHDSYEGLPVDGRAWLETGGGDCHLRVLRGGAFYLEPLDVRSAYRGWDTSRYADVNVGFRLAQDLR